MGHRLQNNVGKSPGIYRMDKSGQSDCNRDKSRNYQGIFNRRLAVFRIEQRISPTH